MVREKTIKIRVKYVGKNKLITRAKKYEEKESKKKYATNTAYLK